MSSGAIVCHVSSFKHDATIHYISPFKGDATIHHTASVLRGGTTLCLLFSLHGGPSVHNILLGSGATIHHTIS